MANAKTANKPKNFPYLLNHPIPYGSMTKPSLEFNVAAHDKIAKKYESLHVEIYNETEQQRLIEAVNDAVGRLPSSDSAPLVLDFGCGAGNLTKRFVDAGCDVIASDVSSEFLKLVRSQSAGANVTTLRLNGKDLREIESESVDMVATYSVLHHVPDYLSIVREFARVVKPGGIIFIDHERSSSYWARLSEFRAAYKQMVVFPKQYAKLLRPENYRTWFVRRFMDSRYSPEGDIHVYPDDHIEWDKIDGLLLSEGFRLVRAQEYLLFRGDYSPAQYRVFSERLHDMRLLIAQKGNPC